MVRLIVLLGLLFVPGPVIAVENVATTPASYNGIAPTGKDIPNWGSGWSQPVVQPIGFTSTTGWNYCGTINGNSAVYLGNGWVLTAAHNGIGDFTVGGVVYPQVPNSIKTFGPADLILFQVAPAPALPPLPIRTTDPKPAACQVAMLGWGHADGNRAVTWGWNTVTNVNQPVTLLNNGTTYSTTDFFTLTQIGNGNNYQLVEGDSGGAVFIYNSTVREWELAGINEAVVSDSGAAPFYSAMVQLDVYRAQMITAEATTDTPALPFWAIIVLAAALIGVAGPMSTVRRLS